MLKAKEAPVTILYHPDDPIYDEAIRRFQGCPTVAATRGGRIFLGWYSGGVREPDMENYNILVFSDDGGNTWSKPLLVIPSDKQRLVHALDIQLFVDPVGTLHVCWVQNNTRPAPEDAVEGEKGVHRGYVFSDVVHAEWEITCENPDADTLLFSEPRYLYPGFLRCKPLFLSDTHWLCFAYNQMTDTYCYSETFDAGMTFRSVDSGVKKIPTPFDEPMAYVMPDGRIRFLARSTVGRLAEMFSADGGRTWSEAKESDIVHANTRFYVSYTPSGRLLLVINDDPASRTNMTVCLSSDGGKTFPIRRRIDTRRNISYPDVAFFGNRICLTYDFGRVSAGEIAFYDFTEEDLMDPGYEFVKHTVSHAAGNDTPAEN